MAFIGTWIATAAAAALSAWIVPGMTNIGGFVGIALFALVIIAVNAVIRPLMQALALPLNMVTLGLFRFVVNTLALMFASWLTLNIFDVGVHFTGFLPALLGSLIISLITTVVESMLNVERA